MIKHALLRHCIKTAKQIEKCFQEGIDDDCKGFLHIFHVSQFFNFLGDHAGNCASFRNATCAQMGYM